MIDYSKVRLSLKRLEQQYVDHRQGNPALSDPDREGVAESEARAAWPSLYRGCRRFVVQVQGNRIRPRMQRDFRRRPLGRN